MRSCGGASRAATIAAVVSGRSCRGRERADKIPPAGLPARTSGAKLLAAPRQALLSARAWARPRRMRLMRALADSDAFWIGLFGLIVVVYMLPTLIRMIR